MLAISCFLAALFCSAFSMFCFTGGSPILGAINAVLAIVNLILFAKNL